MKANEPVVPLTFIIAFAGGAFGILMYLLFQVFALGSDLQEQLYLTISIGLLAAVAVAGFIINAVYARKDAAK